MSHILKDEVVVNGKPIATFDLETCEYLIDLMNEIASISLSGNEYTFSTPKGKIIFKIGGPSGVTLSAEGVFKTDVKYTIKHDNKKKSIEQMAKEANGRSRACVNCSLFMNCNMITQKICNNAFVEGYTKGYKQVVKVIVNAYHTTMKQSIF